ncbi:SMC-Scp complex subunit ScpB [Fuchsiella alkaliacetigena]|uniref:SMC-Scp complex subunit ScpB n=1 Tax=Fuchsiella alkaliacetigena TaxID=957042 RepID=UPI00200B0855|nr:SMC-Scp complex subunit ScpB [Fuchsiella alkaliacetigena]MCK8825724.1 SMC-Scp complex subunit ScpB [Fuchsiella alkaliacetigena]
MVENKKALVEALLFMAAEPIEVAEISKVSDLTAVEIEEALEQLEQDYQDHNRGMELIQIGEGFRLQTKPQYATYVEELYQPEVEKSLTPASLETLTIVAYKQPVTRAEIEDIRGVNVEKALRTLQKKDLVTKLGRKDTIGNPIIYGTSDKFLEYFGLEDLSQLPEPEELPKLEDLKKEEMLEEKLLD